MFLSDAKKPEHGALVDGSGKTGWTLTPAGLRWARRVAPRVLREDLTRGREDRRGGPPQEQRWRRERNRILKTRAWGRWTQGDRAIPANEAAEVFRIDVYSVGRMRGLKITRLRSLFEDDPTIIAFLEHLSTILEQEEEPND